MVKGDKFDVAVVGAGLAGMMAAGVAAESSAKASRENCQSGLAHRAMAEGDFLFTLKQLKW